MCFVVALYSFVCSCSRNMTKCFLSIIIHIFSTYFAINLLYLLNLKTWRNYGRTTALCIWRNEIKTKTKPSSVTSKLTTRSIVQFSSQTMAQIHFLLVKTNKDWLSRTLANPLCATARGNILSIGNLCFRVFKLQLKVMNKSFMLLSCHVRVSEWIHPL